VPGPSAVTVDASILTQALLDTYTRSGVSVVYLTDTSTGLPAGSYVIPAGMIIRPVQQISFAGAATINAYDGTLDLANGSILGVGGASLVILNKGDKDAFSGKISSAVIADVVEKIPASPAAITVPTVLPALTIGGPGGTSSADFTAFAGSSARLYVAGNFVNNAVNPFSGGALVTVYGDTESSADITLTAGTILLGKLTAADDITAAGLDNFTGALDTGGYTVTASAGTVSLASLDGVGTLELSGTVTNVSIGGGTGNIQVTGTAPAFASGANPYRFGNTGWTTFENNVSVADQPIEFTGAVSFEGNLALTAVGATFSDTASFADGKTISLTTAASVITLGPNGALAQAGAGGGAILENSGTGSLTLTPGGAVTLNFDLISTVPTLSQSGDAGVTIAGKADLVQVYMVEQGTGSVPPLELDNGAEFNITGAGKLVLTSDGTYGAALTGDGKVIAGGTEIAGGSGGWGAVEDSTSTNPTIAITRDTITASNSAAILTGGTNALITVLADKTLTIAANTAIDLENGGSLVLTAAAVGGRLNLDAATARIIGLTGGSTNRVLTISDIADADYELSPTAGYIAGSGSSGAGGAAIAGSGAGSYIQANDGAGGSDAAINASTTIGS
jgi:hypothetical protein